MKRTCIFTNLSVNGRRRMNSGHLIATAHHEAGHAVVALHYGRKVRAVSIEPGQDYLGLCRSNLTFGPSIEYSLPNRVRLRIEQEIRILFAGEMAQRHFSYRSWRPIHSSSDRKNALNLLTRLTSNEEEFPIYMRLLELQTKHMVQSNFYWKQITLLAQTLLEKPTMREQEIMDLLNLVRAKKAVDLTGLKQRLSDYRITIHSR